MRGPAELDLRAGDADAALEKFNRSLALQPLADTHRSLCHLYGMHQDFARAAEHAQRAVELDPDDPIALMLAAGQLLRAGQPAAAERYFQKALTLCELRRDGTHPRSVHCCVLLNGAGYLAVKHERDNALRLLQAFFETPNHRHIPRSDLCCDPDLASLRELPAFAAGKVCAARRVSLHFSPMK